MKLFLLTITLSVFSYTGFSQDWQEIMTTDSLTISVKEIQYQDLTNDINHQRWVFKYKNLSSSSIEIHFNRELIYDGKQYIQDEQFSIEIPANGVLEYDDSRKKNKVYYIFKKDNNGWIKESLDTFKFINLNIK